MARRRSRKQMEDDEEFAVSSDEAPVIESPPVIPRAQDPMDIDDDEVSEVSATVRKQVRTLLFNNAKGLITNRDQLMPWAESRRLDVTLHLRRAFGFELTPILDDGRISKDAFVIRSTIAEPSELEFISKSSSFGTCKNGLISTVLACVYLKSNRIPEDVLIELLESLLGECDFSIDDTRYPIFGKLRDYVTGTLIKHKYLSRTRDHSLEDKSWVYAMGARALIEFPPDYLEKWIEEVMGPAGGAEIGLEEE